MKVAKAEFNGEFEKQLFCGLAEMKIVGINPTRAEMMEIYGREPKDEDKPELEYISEDSDGNDRVQIKIFAQETKTKEIFNFSFFITDTDRYNKAATKREYLNQVCQSTWAEDEEGLPEWFTNFLDRDKNSKGSNATRVARMGEGTFYEFVRAVMRGVNYFSPETEVEFNFKKLIKGNFSELRDYLMNDELSFPFTSLLFIKNVEGDDGTIKTYNNVYTKRFLPSGIIDRFNSHYSDFVDEYMKNMDQDEKDTICEALSIQESGITADIVKGFIPNDAYPTPSFNKTYEQNNFDYFVKDVTGEFGCSGFYKLAPMFTYEKGMHITDDPSKVLVEEDTDTPF